MDSTYLNANVRNTQKGDGMAGWMIGPLIGGDVYAIKLSEALSFQWHKVGKETPLPINVGLNIHAEIRKRWIVNALFNVWSIHLILIVSCSGAYN